MKIKIEEDTLELKEVDYGTPFIVIDTDVSDTLCKTENRHEIIYMRTRHADIDGTVDPQQEWITIFAFAAYCQEDYDLPDLFGLKKLDPSVIVKPYKNSSFVLRL